MAEDTRADSQSVPLPRDLEQELAERELMLINSVRRSVGVVSFDATTSGKEAAFCEQSIRSAFAALRDAIASALASQNKTLTKDACGVCEGTGWELPIARRSCASCKGTGKQVVAPRLTDEQREAIEVARKEFAESPAVKSLTDAARASSRFDASPSRVSSNLGSSSAPPTTNPDAISSTVVVESSSAPQEQKDDGWHIHDQPTGEGDARKIVALEADGMVWIGIRAWHAGNRTWLNGGEPEGATVKAWRDLPSMPRIPLPLTAEQQKVVDDFRQQMQDVVIPRIVEGQEERERRRRAKWRDRQ